MKLKTMRRNLTSGWRTTLVPALLGLGLLAGGCGKQHQAGSVKNSNIAGQLEEFTSEKEAQAKAAASAERKELSPEYKKFLAAARKGDWPAIHDAFRKLGRNDLQSSGTMEAVAKEIDGAYKLFDAGGKKFFEPLGREIIQSIPPGSIYFGGTDVGRFLITAMVTSQVKGDPFFVLTQNALADSSYLAYLRSMYNGKIYTPTEEDSQQCFNDYLGDATQRLHENKLQPGENVRIDNGRTQLSGPVAVMGINALLARVIFDKNPDREFYLEESFPLAWMYPYLEPHGLILKVNRQPLAAMSEEVMQADHDYWTKYLTPLIGDWLKDDTSVQDVCAFAKKVQFQRDLSGFKGDSDFVQNKMAKRTLSKLRTSIANVYIWRLSQPSNTEGERQSLIKAADFAFRQAVAVCPDNSEAVALYAKFLSNQQRTPDAALVARLSGKAMR